MPEISDEEMGQWLELADALSDMMWGGERGWEKEGLTHFVQCLREWNTRRNKELIDLQRMKLVRVFQRMSYEERLAMLTRVRDEGIDFREFAREVFELSKIDDRPTTADMIKFARELTREKPDPNIQRDEERLPD